MDEPQYCQVGRDTQEHVDKLEAQVPNEHSGHVPASLVHRLLSSGRVEGPVGDEERRGVWVENVHGAQIWGASGRSNLREGRDHRQRLR